MEIGLGIASILYILFMIGMFGLSVYCMFLFIKFARKGIQAFEIYIDKNSSGGLGQ
ncbi:hypothetical protein [Fusibacter sp. JL216-2]|uniref:hypothetical protein n=1 Tax=Fusibacter sp. JL216-2 TaxID=3071453 RepID=UPI003D34DAF8